MARVVFLGTPQAAVPTLERLTGEHEVGLVITQPDRPRGRSKRPMPSPVKELALSRDLQISQPTTRHDLAETVQTHGPFEVGVVVAYGRILRREVLEAPEHGLLNVHFSLLPRWRGAAPVARALMAGDSMTGVTIIQLDEGLDTGPVLTAQAVDIDAEENAGELTARLADLGARLLVQVLPSHASGDVDPIPQTDEGLTYADKIEREDRPIDMRADPVSVVNQIRGLAPTPAATMEIDGQVHKIYEARTSDIPVEAGTWMVDGGRPVVGLGGGAIELITLQPPGKTLRSGSDWVNGQRSDAGMVR